MKGLLTLLVLAGISAGVFALGSFRRGSDGKPLLHVAEEVALTVNVVKPSRETITRLVQAPGDVEAVLEVEISAEIVSKIIDMPVQEGDSVQAGDVLCRLDDKNLLADVESGEARIAQLGAAVAQAEADLEKATRDYSRQERLSESDATSDIEVRDYLTVKKKAASLLDMRRYELVQVQALLKRLIEELKKTVITSPITGVVTRLNAKQGEVVVTGTMNNPGTVIMSISDLSRMQVRARVDEVDVPHVRANQPVRVYLQSDPNSPVPARVVRVASKGTKTTGRDVVTFEALLEVLSTDPRIKPGMTANVEIEVDRRDEAITVPIEAIVHRMRKDLPEAIVKAFDESQAGLELSERAKQGQYIKVLYVMEEEKAQVRLIDAGIADTRRVEIRNGISLEDSVVIGPYRSLDQLADGKKIEVPKEDKPKSEDQAIDDDADSALTEGEENKNEDELSEGDHDEQDESAHAGKDKQQTVATRSNP